MFRLCGFMMCLLTLGAVTARGQLPMGPAAGVRMINTDMAVLEAGDVRKDLPCAVTPMKSALVGFDLRFHTSYDVTVPLKDLVGNENLLTILFRVIPNDHKDRPSYFVQRIRVPSVAEDARGEAQLQGFFDVGEGGYHVDWLMRDRAERVCSFYWDVDATLPAKDRSIKLAIEAGSIQKIETESFLEDPPVARIRQDPPLSVKVLLNYAPQSPNLAAMRPIDTSALVSILRGIYRDPRIAKFSLVAFSMHEQKVLYRQISADRIDFPALGEALQAAKPGTVDARKLNQKHGDTEFLTELIMN
ncbi:MAG: acetyltransferase, partial [Bryobacteraceae bacterium]